MDKNILILSAGENIHNTFPVCFSELPSLDEIYIIVEEDVCRDNADDPEYKRETKPKIRTAIREVCDLSKKLKRNCHVTTIQDTSLESVRDRVLMIAQDHPGAHITFNISGGTKMLSISLFLMALWIDADVCLTPRESELMPLSIPRMHLDDITKKANYLSVLRILSSSLDGSSSRGEWMLRRDLTPKLQEIYVAERYDGDKKTDRVLSRGTFTKILDPLITWNLIERRDNPKNKRECQYRITHDGLFTLRFVDAQKRSQR
jgi:hypothetical protein